VGQGSKQKKSRRKKLSGAQRRTNKKAIGDSEGQGSRAPLTFDGRPAAVQTYDPGLPVTSLAEASQRTVTVAAPVVPEAGPKGAKGQGKKGKKGKGKAAGGRGKGKSKNKGGKSSDARPSVLRTLPPHLLG
jgi:hypothetical protein